MWAENQQPQRRGHCYYGIPERYYGSGRRYGIDSYYVRKRTDHTDDN